MGVGNLEERAVPLRSPFTPDWPRYAVAAHVLFWSVSAVFLVSCLAGYAGLVGGQIIISLFWVTIIAAFLLGAAAVASGQLYVGNQVFYGTPLTGWPARLWGLAVVASTLMVMLFLLSLTHLRG